MAHPVVDQRTPFALEMLVLADVDNRVVFVPLIKATYSIQTSGSVCLLLDQVPVNLAGEHWGDPEQSSYKYEPETAYYKPATDIVLIGHAYAPKSGATEVEVKVRVGQVQKAVRVIGDRMMVRRAGLGIISSPEPFEKMPLIYERAFGGWDRRDPSKTCFEVRNPVGMGYRHGSLSLSDEVQLPNLEEPDYPLERYGDSPPPAGFGFISPNWQPRASLAGTYDDSWNHDRKPLLPKDFDPRFFNAASPGLVAPGYLQGDEPVVVLNASPNGRVTFRLPGISPPKCDVELRGRKRETIQTQLDTVVINMDEHLLFMTWRAHLRLQNGPHDIVAIKIYSDTNIPIPALV